MFLGLVVMAIAVFIFFYSFHFSKFNRDGTLPLGPRFYPQLIGIGLFICGLVLSIKNTPYSITLPRETVKSNAKVILLSIFYILCFEALGYIISTCIFIVAVVFFLGYRRILVSIFYSVLLTGSLYVLFYILMKIPLPGGLISHRFF